MQRKKEFYDKLLSTKIGSVQPTRVIRTEKKVGKIWECRCDCGATFETRTSVLKNMSVKCPECVKANKAKAHADYTKRARLRKVWREMKRRCADPKCKEYKFYGAKGISVCDEWRSDFRTFESWAHLNGYDPDAKRGECTLDRIDVQGDYSPENCRWISMTEQLRNMTTNVYITAFGETRLQVDWARIIGISHSAFSQAKRRGVDISEFTEKHLRRIGYVAN